MTAPARPALALAASALVVAILLSGCTGIIVQDDLAVMRTGKAAGSKLTLVVNDAGTATCNGHKSVPISDPQLLQARYLSTSLQTDAQKGVSLRPGPMPVFHYYVQTPNGHVSFSDDSPRVPSLFSQVALLVLQISQTDCGLAL